MEGWNGISVLPIAGAPSVPLVANRCIGHMGLRSSLEHSLVPMGMGGSIARMVHRSEGVTTNPVCPSGLG